MIANMLKVQIDPSRITVAATVRRHGTVTYLKRCQRLAPSTSAASYNSQGIDCRPPSSTTIMNDTPSQMFTTMQLMNSQYESDNQGTDGSPMPVMIELTSPVSVSMSRHM